MRYVVYLDGLFLECFLWNLCVLEMVNEAFWKSAGHLRLIFGAVAGASGMTGLLFLPVPVWGKYMLELLVVLGMLFLAFPVRNIRKCGALLERFWIYTILFGSALWVAGKAASALLPKGWKFIYYLFLGTAIYFLWKTRRRKRPFYGGEKCERVVLIQGGKVLYMEALVDTGNSLYEPISGRPVCVMDSGPAAEFWPEDAPCRIVPYQSVGAERGVMRAYRLKELQIEMEGLRLIRKDIYVAISPKPLSCFLIHPQIMVNKEQAGHRKGEKVL